MRLAFLALLLAGCATLGPDLAREKRLADEVVPGLVVGDAVRLEAGEQRFIGLLAPAKGKTKGGVVLVHGTGVHPDFGIVGQLRASLADLGYTTLSVQMPVLAAGAPPERYVDVFPQAADRLSAAVRFMNARGFRRVAVVSHSMGARMANHWLSRRPTEPVAAWVPLAVSSGELESLTGLPFPVYDIYAEKDFDVVVANARERAAVLRKIRGSKQVMVYGTDHAFTKKEKELAVLLDQLLAPVLR
jgi:alpha/beta superfamily hydrolase